MSMRYYCTYFDKGYLVRAIALHASLSKHESQPFTLYAVCLDELTRILLERLQLPGVSTIPLHEIENGDNELRKARLNRNLVEYYWTLTPTVIIRLLEWNPHVEMITYLDADLFFFSSPQPIFDELVGHSVLIHEHRFHEEFKPALKYGRFNVGLLCFRRNRDAVAVLNWWRDRCNEWCYARLESGRFGDQLYLEDWPERFSGVHVLSHIGAGLAPWNNLQYDYSVDVCKQVSVNNQPVIFYHFHGLQFAHTNYVVLSKIFAHKFTLEIIRCFYLPYVKSLHCALNLVRHVMPGFEFGLSGYAAIEYTAILKDVANLRVMADADGFVTTEPVPLGDEYLLWPAGQLM